MDCAGDGAGKLDPPTDAQRRRLEGCFERLRRGQDPELVGSELARAIEDVLECDERRGTEP
ncbi:MAG: hypothetical protein P1P84_04660 [Deferrisomatales bacterium]|nr:hypothetical protein [Deferrisomatales bacterium]